MNVRGVYRPSYRTNAVTRAVRLSVRPLHRTLPVRPAEEVCP